MSQKSGKILPDAHNFRYTKNNLHPPLGAAVSSLINGMVLPCRFTNN